MPETSFPFFPNQATADLWPQGGLGASATSAVPSTGTGSNPQFWIPVWAGEVLNAYSEYNMFEPLVQSDTITSGTTKRFPITGTVGIKPIWNAGQELIGDSGSSSAPGWFDISLDQRPMASHFELDDIHLMLTQWDYRSEIARQAGLQLANARDKQLACMIGQAAFTANRAPYSSSLAGMSQAGSASPLPPDNTLNKLGFGTAAEQATAAFTLLRYIEEYMVKLQEVNVDARDVYVAVSPRAFHSIRMLGVARENANMLQGGNTPMFVGNQQVGGLGTGLANGMTGSGDVLEYFGAKIVKTNHLQTQNVVAGTEASGNYATNSQLGDAKYDFAWGTKNVKALIWQKAGVCSLRLQGMKVESIKDIRRGTNFTVASIMAGAGVLRPELCGAFTGTNETPTLTASTILTGLLAAGGQTITLTGTNLFNCTSIVLAGNVVTNIKLLSPTSLSFVTPAHAAGTTLNAVFTNTAGTTGTLGGFSYV